MNDQEKEIQRALGLLKTYSGYVKARGSNSSHYDVYEVEDVTKTGAREQLNTIVANAQKRSIAHLELIMVIDETEPIWQPAPQQF